MGTMTTIGYGDRGPSTKAETILCMFCEIIGLSFFALLLTQVNNLYHTVWDESRLPQDKLDLLSKGIAPIAANATDPRMQALEERVDQSLAHLKSEVDSMVAAIAGKLDKLAAG